MDDDLRRLTIAAGVPIEIDHLKRHGGPSDWQREQAQQRYRETTGKYADTMLYGGQQRTQVAPAMQALIEALAVLAFQPGGVTFSGLHFEATIDGE